jgi:16S rRNA (uracil1498-N3)-methyltransferase
MKRPPWLLVEAGEIADGLTLEIGAAEARHAVGALRLRSGDEIFLADGCGTVASGVLCEVSAKRVLAEIRSIRLEEPPASPGVIIGMAIVDRQPMDWAVQKAVEIGVRGFVPLFCERSQRKGRDLGGRLDHWRKTALQALKQCRRPWAMELGEPVELAEFVERIGGFGLVADPGGAALHQVPEQPARALAVGPEGGFSNTENELFDEAGWRRIRLAGNILRAETAAVVGAAMLVARDEGLL